MLYFVDKAIPKRGVSQRSLEQAVQTLRVAAHPLRIRLLERLERSAGPLSVNDLARQLRQPQYAISQHLSRLYLNGLLRRRQRGREVFYRIADKRVIELLQWVRRCQHDDTWVRTGEGI